MMENTAVRTDGGVAMTVARLADSVVAEWKRGRQRLAPMWSRRDELAMKESLTAANADDLLTRLDPLVAVRWRGSW
ncbi:hypothetical protein ACIA8C_05905 [Nocardia sp. NPDC051321]|uniref:hypothetical protein n=1 Tax=Nocardia sp. NPDC051321 TaxID=3364323 RepID=UPI0037BBF0FE